MDPENAKEVQETKDTEQKSAKGKKFEWTEKTMEVIVAVFLAITALLTAWASWIGSLHGGNQATNYTKSNNLSAEGNSMYNEGAQNYMQDLALWSDITDLQLEVQYAKEHNDNEAAELASYKLYYRCSDNLTEDMAAVIGWDFDAAASASNPTKYIDEWLAKEEATTSPFTDEFVNGYYAAAQDMIAESDKLLEEGQQDNKNGDTFNLVVVFYSVVLFLLGIAGTFKNLPNRKVVIIASLVIFALSTVYMFFIPMPTGFSLLSFFVH